MPIPPEVSKLIERFQQNIDDYRSGRYNETQVRREFIDPLFIALGWDVANERGAREAYKDVIHEDAIKIGDALKAPDYAFRIGDTRKFFVEAKKPSVNVKREAPPAFQARRYGWSATLPFSIVTDFEEFAVYDCRIEPGIKDKAETARILYLTYDQYAERWDEIAGLFSRDAVLNGSLERFADEQKAGKGATPVDTAFLKVIEGWRKTLAQNIAPWHTDLDQQAINYAVQMTIDRIIFLRICEDRGIEPHSKLLALVNGGNIYARLCDLFKQADRRYNSGLFHFDAEKGRETPDTLTLGLHIDDEPLRAIIKDLYYPSPYAFAVIPIEILGQVYEQFLGKVIRLDWDKKSGKRIVEVEYKPEVRKAGGVYYTPTYIVDYIVRHTVGKLLDGKTPEQAAHLRILDPACGSGSFLIGAYQYLLDWYRDWYVSDGPDKHPQQVYQAAGGAWRLTTAERKRILLNNLYGVDIDPQAVETTKLSLLLRVLEGETDENISRYLKVSRERALPDLAANIKCGNSLIGYDFMDGKALDPATLARVNPFDWQAEFPAVMQAGGFDAVIGNPPYIRIQALKEWAALEVEFYKDRYVAAGKGNYDIYVTFVEKGLSLLNERGVLGFILPHKFFNAQYGEPLRGLIASGQHLSHVVHFGDQQIFAGATTYTCLMFLDKTARDQCQFVKVDDLAAWRADTGSPKGIAAGDVLATHITAAEWNFTVGDSASLFERLRLMPVKLGDVADRIFQGLVTSCDSVYFLDPIAPETNGYIKVKSQATGKEYELETGVVKPLCKGSRDIRRYTATPSKYVLFPYNAEESAKTGTTFLISSADFASLYPRAWDYLNENAEVLKNREKGKMQREGWYGYVYPKSVSLFAKRKILTPSIGSHASYMLDENGSLYFVGSGGGGGGGYGIILKDGLSIDYKYLLGLLNSLPIDYFLKHISSPFQHGYFAYSRQFIEQLPIRTINFDDPADKARHDHMVGLVEQMLALHRQLATAHTPQESTRIQRQIDATDRQIDRLVYELYGLSDAEVRIVEGAQA